MAQSQAALSEAQANAVEAISNARRARNLAESGALSEQETTRYLTAEGAAKARIKSATASLTSQKLRLKYTKVIAPDSGVISARSATVGSVVGVGVELFPHDPPGPPGMACRSDGRRTGTHQAGHKGTRESREWQRVDGPGCA